MGIENRLRDEETGARCWGVMLATMCTFAAPAAAQPAPSEATVAAHVAAARNAAGTDLRALTTLCAPAPAARPSHAQVDAAVAAQIRKPAPAPGKAFDNLYFVGAAWVSAWALDTADGIVLIDALNNKAEAAALIEGGLQKLGLDPARIKYVIVTHGHGDHYGGVPYLVERYKPRVAMSELDWTMTETKLEFESSLWGEPPKRDLAVADGDKLTLGDSTLILYLTPGHTLGTLTPVFEVKSAGKTHKAMLWGGTSFNFGKDMARLNRYIEATQRMARLAEEQQIDVLLSNHSGYDDSLAKLDSVRKQGGMSPNPSVMGSAGVTRALTVMGECAQAQRDRFLMQP